MAVRPSSTEFARQLRRDMTQAEWFLWDRLRGKQLGGFKFRRQQQIEHRFVDFYCPDKKVVIEIDGESHDARVEEDLARDKALRSLGHVVLRFRNEEVFDRLDWVLATIQQVCDSRPSKRASPSPTPPVEGGALLHPRREARILVASPLTGEVGGGGRMANESMPELDQLRTAALSCTSCSLAERRRNVVFGEGNPRSPLVVVGEGPGDTEDATGRPFVGRAGQLLDKALADNSLSREDVYICNTLKCRACDWSSGKPVNRAPAPDEVEACRRWLIPQLRMIGPKVILCVGAPSAKNLIKKDFRITLERGKYFPCELAKTAIATLHPAYILRNQSATSDGGYSLLVADVAKAWAAAQRLAAKSPDRPAVRVEELQTALFDA